MRAALVCAGIVWSAAAVAETPPTAQPAYKAALAKGRKLQSESKLTDAIAAFNAAIALAPDDPIALAELGYTAYLAHDLPTAEQATRHALDRHPPPALQGSTLYNLGLIQEAQGNKAAAIKSYQASLKARPNSTVQAHLAKLSGAAAPAADRFAPAKMAGPYSSIAAACKASPPNTDDDPTHCSCGDVAEGTGPIALPGPYSAATIYTSGCHANGGGSQSYMLGVPIAGKWYVAYLYELEAGEHCEDSVKVKPPTSHGALSLIDLEAANDCGRDTPTEQWRGHWVFALGLGPSHHPSLARLPIAQSDATGDDAGKLTPTVDRRFTLTWSGDNTVVIAATKLLGMEPDDAASTVGSHTLVFP